MAAAGAGSGDGGVKIEVMPKTALLAELHKCCVFSQMWHMAVRAEETGLLTCLVCTVHSHIGTSDASLSKALRVATRSVMDFFRRERPPSGETLFQWRTDLEAVRSAVRDLPEPSGAPVVHAAERTAAFLMRQFYHMCALEYRDLLAGWTKRRVGKADKAKLCIMKHGVEFLCELGDCECLSDGMHATKLDMKAVWLMVVNLAASLHNRDMRTSLCDVATDLGFQQYLEVALREQGNTTVDASCLFDFSGIDYEVIGKRRRGN